MQKFDAKTLYHALETLSLCYGDYVNLFPGFEDALCLYFLAQMLICECLFIL